MGLSVHSWARSRGAQLTAGYTVNTFSVYVSTPAAGRATHGTRSRACRPYAASADYTLGAFAPLLAHAKNEVDRTTRSGDMAKAKPSADRQTDTTYQPTGQQPFCQYPAVSWEFHDPAFALLGTIPACDGRTDRQTDGQTSGHVAVAKTCASIASRG